LDDTPGIIATALAEAHIEVSTEALSAVARHLEMVTAANLTMNLTSVTEPRQAAWIHVVDSLLGLPVVTGGPDGELCDLGSGAGFPGIPLCASSQRRTVLVESTGKKAAFLRTVVEALGLPATVLPLRAEQVGAEHAGRFAVVTARALSALPSVLELGAPLLAQGGLLIVYKGAPDEREVGRGERAAALLGLRKREESRFTLAGAEAAQRTLFVYERVGPSKVALPRRDGLAQHSPLA
jgi:16S rRNA (guanine527-N7)-methyltransferase